MIRTNYRTIASGSHFTAAVIVCVCAFVAHILSLADLYGALNTFLYIGNNSGSATTVIFSVYLFVFTLPFLCETVSLLCFYFGAKKNGGGTFLGVLYGIEIVRVVYLSLLAILSVFLFFFTVSSGDYIPGRWMALFIIGSLLYFSVLAVFFVYRGKVLSALSSGRMVFMRNVIYSKPSMWIAVTNLVTAIFTFVIAVAVYFLVEGVLTDVKNNGFHLFMHSRFVTFLVLSLSLKGVVKILFGTVLCKARAVFPDSVPVVVMTSEKPVIPEDDKDVCIYCGGEVEKGEKCQCRKDEEDEMTYCIYCGREIKKGQICPCKSEREDFSGEEDDKICIFCGRVIKKSEKCTCMGAIRQ